MIIGVIDWARLVTLRYSSLRKPVSVIWVENIVVNIVWTNSQSDQNFSKFILPDTHS